VRVPAPLSAAEIAATARWIASVQLPNGMLPWYRGGHADPWNHTEAAMALAAAGHWHEVERAFCWLQETQLPDGSWCTFHLPDGVEEPRRDPNVCAYVATGAWWCYLLLGGGENGDGTTRRSNGVLQAAWPMVERAISWGLGMQRPGGEVAWSAGPDGVVGSFALLAANSSFHHSLRSAALAGAALGTGSPWPAWLAAARRVSAAVAMSPASFAPKERWAMDWYYPVLAGIFQGEEGRRRLRSRWEDFVIDGLGVRCVADRAWVTAAETAECSMAAFRVGLRAEAEALLAWAGHLRDANDGAYWTGCAHPDCVHFPGGQKTTYSAAAVLIADHVLYGRSPASEVFGGESVLGCEYLTAHGSA